MLLLLCDRVWFFCFVKGLLLLRNGNFLVSIFLLLLSMSLNCSWLVGCMGLLSGLCFMKFVYRLFYFCVGRFF